MPLAAPLAPIVVEACEGRGEHDSLFPGPRGGYINSKNLSSAYAIGWFRIRESIAKFAPDEAALHWHDLRHTAAVMLFRAGLSAPDVQAILGHSSLAVTQMYANTRNDAVKRGAVALRPSMPRNREVNLKGVRKPQKPALTWTFSVPDGRRSRDLTIFSRALYQLEPEPCTRRGTR